jgi:uncharacterized membrane protein YeaQ/YmgE (transglycosylase-associated protein family)
MTVHNPVIAGPIHNIPRRQAAGGDKEGSAMHLMLWVTVGILAGALAKAAVPDNVLLASKGPWGVSGDLVSSVLGALAGGWLFHSFLGDSYSGWIGSTFVAFIGALVVLVSLRFATGGRTA